MDIKKFVEEQIDDIVRFKQERSSDLSVDEFISLHRQLECYLRLLG